MPKYLIQASYTSDGAKGLISEGGTSRVKAVADVVQSLGGSVDCFYFAFGTDDVVTVIDVPDTASAAALAMTIGATGLVSIRTTVLITPEEIDSAAQKSVGYRGPGR